MNYIEKYYGQIISGEVVVSDKVRRVMKHLVDKLHDKNPNTSTMTTKRST